MKGAMLQHLLLRVPFHNQAKELTLADLAKEQRVEQRQAGVKIRVLDYIYIVAYNYIYMYA